MKFSYEDQTRYDYWQRMEFTLAQWQGLKAHCDDVGLTFISSPFSNAAVDLLEEIGVTQYKVGSGEVSNFLLLEKIAQTGKPLILSSGMSSWTELDDAITFLDGFGNPLTVLQCTTKYPTQPQDIGLNVITTLKERYNKPVGFSDHSGTVYPALAAVTLGASVLEVHTVFDQRIFGPDSLSSLTIDNLKQLVDGVRFLETSLNNPINKADVGAFEPVKQIFEKSLAVNKPLQAGHVIEFMDLEGKKPAGCGISAKKYRQVIGKTITRDLAQWDFLQESDLA